MNEKPKGGFIYAPGAVAAGNGRHGFYAANGGKIIAPGSTATANGEDGYHAESGGEIDLSDQNLLAAIGLPEDTPMVDLAMLIRALQSTPPSQVDQVVKSSSLKNKLGEKLTDAVVGKICEMLVTTAGRALLQACGIPTS